MAVSVATLGLQLDSSGMRSGLNDLKQVERAGKRAADALDDAGTRGKRATAGLASGFGTLKAAIATLGLGAAIKQVVSINDEYARITGRLKLVTSGTEQLAKVQESLFQVAQRTGVAYEETANLYAKVAKNAEALGLSQQQLLDFTEVTNQAIQVSGASAMEAAGGVRQLGQALASGALRGDEFNSLAENMPRLRDAIADGLGISIGELRKFAAEGKLTAEVVTQALLSQAATIKSEFAQLPRTVGRATQELENEVKRAIAGADISPLTSSIDNLKKTLSDPAVIQGIQSIAQGLISLAGLAAKAAGAFGNLGTSIGEAAARFQLHGSTLEKILAFSALSNPVTAVWTAKRIFGDRTPAEIVEEQGKQVGTAVGRFFGELDRLTGVGGNQIIVPLRSAAETIVPYANSVGKAATAVAKLSEDTEKQLVTMRAVNAMLQQGVPLEEAMTRAKLLDAEASAEQTSEYLKLEKAIDKAREATKKYKDITDPIGTSLGAASNIAEEVRRLGELKQAQDAVTDSARAYVDALERSYGRQLGDMGRGPAASRYSAGQQEIEDQFLSQRQDLTGRLSGQLAEGTIDQDSYNQQLSALDAYQQEAMAKWDSYYAKLEQRSADFATGFNDVVLSYLDSTRNLGASLAGDVVNAIDSATAATSRLAAETLLWGSGGVEAAKAIARSVITDVVSALIRVGIQYGINSALQNTAIASTTAAAVGSAGTIATAQVGANSAIAASAAPAAAATSLASFGTNIGPAIAAIAGAYAAARIFNIGFKDGGYTGDGGVGDVAGAVHGQEFVMHAEATRRHRPLLEHLNAGGTAPIRSVQSAQPAGGMQAARPIVRVKVANTIDRSEFLRAIDNEDFDQILENRISRNASRYRSMLVD